MMVHRSPVPLIFVLAACGGLDARTPGTGTGDGVGTDVIVGPTAPDGPWDFDTPTTWEPGNEVWSFDLRLNRHDALPDTLWDRLPLVLALEWVAEDDPWLAVRSAAIVADSNPRRQDFCVATEVATGTWSDADGSFALHLGPDQVDFGQPWTWDRLELAGTLTELGTVDPLVATGSIGATELAVTAFGPTGAPCDLLAYAGLTCVPCGELGGDCVTIDLELTGRREPGFLVEPINQTDVSLNPACEGSKR